MTASGTPLLPRARVCEQSLCLSLSVSRTLVNLLAEEADDGCPDSHEHTAEAQQHLVLVVLVVVDIVGALDRLLHSLSRRSHSVGVVGVHAWVWARVYKVGRLERSCMHCCWGWGRAADVAMRAAVRG